nr:hypothetical protein [Tanacetum cinerariifolium]
MILRILALIVVGTLQKKTVLLEEEEEEEKEESKKKGSKEASKIRSNSESLGYAAFDNEVESDLESSTRSEPKCKEMEDTYESEMQNIIPQIVIQLTKNMNNNNSNANNGSGRNNGCSYKGFLACNPRDYDGKGENQKVRYTASSFINKALTWWNTQVQARGHEAAVGMTWVEFKALLVEEFCPSNKMEKFESEFLKSHYG